MSGFEGGGRKPSTDGCNKGEKKQSPSTWDEWTAQGLPLGPIHRKLKGASRIHDAEWVVPRIQRHLDLHPEPGIHRAPKDDGNSAPKVFRAPANTTSPQQMAAETTRLNTALATNDHNNRGIIDLMTTWLPQLDNLRRRQGYEAFTTAVAQTLVAWTRTCVTTLTPIKEQITAITIVMPNARQQLLQITVSAGYSWWVNHPLLGKGRAFERPIVAEIDRMRVDKETELTTARQEHTAVPPPPPTPAARPTPTTPPPAPPPTPAPAAGGAGGAQAAAPQVPPPPTAQQLAPRQGPAADAQSMRADLRAQTNYQGQTGRLAAAAGGLPAGATVRVSGMVPPDQMTVTPHPGPGPAVSIPTAVFRAQPNLATQRPGEPGEGQPDPHAYGDTGRRLWGPGGPTAADVAQGGIGDCYLMAGLSALAGAGAIRSVFAGADGSAQPVYTVRLYHRPAGSTELQATSVSVSGEVPLGNGSNPAYAGRAPNRPLWPSIIEKAFAQRSIRGYAGIEGGRAADVMEALTGQPAQTNDLVPTTPTDQVLMRLSQYVNAGRPVTCSTQGELQDSEMRLTGNQPAYTARASLPGRIIPGSVRINAGGRTAHDNDKTLSGGAQGVTGQVDYDAATVTFNAAYAINTITASCKLQGLINPTHGIYAKHAYALVGVQGNMISLRNPHRGQIVEVPVGAYASYFVREDVGQVPPAAPPT